MDAIVSSSSAASESMGTTAIVTLVEPVLQNIIIFNPTHSETSTSQRTNKRKDDTEDPHPPA
eukprot:8058-Eustigmatos_ZCMA.PRE.1